LTGGLGQARGVDTVSFEIAQPLGEHFRADSGRPRRTSLNRIGPYSSSRTTSSTQRPDEIESTRDDARIRAISAPLA